MSSPDLGHDNLPDMLPQQRAFNDYLIRNPDHADELKFIAISVYGQIKRMNLPSNQACLAMIRDVMDFTSGTRKTPADIQLFRFLTHKDEYGETLTPEEQKATDALTSRIATETEENGLPDFLRGSFEKQTTVAIQKMKAESQGLTHAALKEMTRFFVDTNLKSFAEIIAGASAESMLDDAVMADLANSVQSIHGAEASIPGIESKNQDPVKTSYSALIAQMNYEASYIVEGKLAAMFRSDNAPKAGRKDALAAGLINMLKQHPDDPALT